MFSLLKRNFQDQENERETDNPKVLPIKPKARGVLDQNVAIYSCGIF